MVCSAWPDVCLCAALGHWPRSSFMEILNELIEMFQIITHEHFRIQDNALACLDPLGYRQICRTPPSSAPLFFDNSFESVHLISFVPATCCSELFAPCLRDVFPPPLPLILLIVSVSRPNGLGWGAWPLKCQDFVTVELKHTLYAAITSVRKNMTCSLDRTTLGLAQY